MNNSSPIVQLSTQLISIQHEAEHRIKVVRKIQNNKSKESSCLLIDNQCVAKTYHLALQNGPFGLAKRPVSERETARLRSQNDMYCFGVKNFDSIGMYFPCQRLIAIWIYTLTFIFPSFSGMIP